MGKIIGIDLGTTNSCVAVMEGNEPSIISNSEGKRTTPSVVAFLNLEGKIERRVGDPAKRQAIINPKNTISSIKRFMGKKYSESSSNTNSISYKLEKGNNDTVRVRIHNNLYSPQEISAIILQKMKSSAEDYLGSEVKDAVITVPAYFNDTERQATKEAGKIAGLNVKRIINEPTAASLAYGLDKKNKDIKIAVFDLGGGTFDISILELGEGVFEVKSTNGDVNLGGDNFDANLIDYLADSFNESEGIDLRKDITALQRLKDASEKAKFELSSSTSTEINLPYITAVDGMPKHLVKTVKRSQFEKLNNDLIKKTLDCCSKALQDAKLSPSEIDEVILVGGSTRIPKIQEEVEKFFEKKPSKGVNPDEVVALGASIQGGVLSGEVKDVLLLDVTPLSLGIETLGGVFTKLIESNTTIPTRKSEVFSTASNNQTSVEIHVLQGERSMVKYNHTIGRFHLDGIPSAPRGVPQIEVSFDIDANGILNVSAKNKESGKEQKIRIESSSGITKDEIEKMKKEAQENAEFDKKERNKVDKINSADSLIFQTENQLKEFGDKISDENKKTINDSLADLKKSHLAKDIEGIDKHMVTLNKLLMDISKDIYKNSDKKEKVKEDKNEDNKKENKDTKKESDNVSDVDYEEVK